MQTNVLELVSWGPYSSLEREGKILSLAVTAKKCTKKHDARAKLFFFA